MNKALEEAISRLKNKIKNDVKYINNPFSDIVYEIIDDNKAIETVLEALDNSVSKASLQELAREMRKNSSIMWAEEVEKLAEGNNEISSIKEIK